MSSEILKLMYGRATHFNHIPVDIMEADGLSSKKKSAPMPASSAGLLRFFEDETRGVKVRPEVVIVLSVGITVTSILLHILLP
ncbi:MAG: preprotein translocase subunit Sec61beta [Nitrososphaerales archaeon]